ncbi:MAG: hypothetical protein MRY72_07390 [Aquisalinus sp.]|nr:hypothetical protein [Aquisalinus sp.]
MDGFEPPEEFPVDLEKILRKRREFEVREPTRFEQIRHYAKWPIVSVVTVYPILKILSETADVIELLQTVVSWFS